MFAYYNLHMIYATNPTHVTDPTQNSYDANNNIIISISFV